MADLAAVYSREIDSKVLTLAPSGWTYKNTFVLYDKETGTLWYPYRKGLMGIHGTYYKKWLPKISSKDTTWKKWSNRHPGTKLMK
ncbi:MAG: DUF3179 domain-containing (seleno)protein [Desulfobacterales bacterium]